MYTIEMAKKYEVIEDNGGKLILAVFNENGKVDYLHTEYAASDEGPRRLMEDLEALKNGDNPAEDWDGNEETPQETYDNIISYEHGWEIVADNDGIYPEKMGCAACLEFGITKE